jgi:GT2 family glycosyltransferase
MIVAGLAAFRNRRDTTLRFLSSVHAEALPADVRIDWTLFDDGSSDGSAELISNNFPDVAIVTGDGDAYWNGAMTVLINRALERNELDALLIANDDIALRPGAMAEALSLFATLNRAGRQTAVVGAFQHDGVTTYSGFRRRPWRGPGALTLVEPSDQPEPCDAFNGNFVLLPASACRAIGGMDGGFRHSGGDIDLGYRLKASGVDIVVAPGHLGHCEKGLSMAARAQRLSRRDRLRLVISPLRSPGDIARLAFKHGGILAPAVILKDLLFRLRIVLISR